MADSIEEEVRSRVLHLLLDKVHADTYPSSTMLDLVEQLLGPGDVGDYAEVLMAKIDGETYPSYALVNRPIALPCARSAGLGSGVRT